MTTARHSYPINLSNDRENSGNLQLSSEGNNMYIVWQDILLDR